MKKQTLTVPIYNEAGEEISQDVIPYNEVREYWDHNKWKTVIELEATPKAHSDDVAASLDLIYGYFKWEMV